MKQKKWGLDLKGKSNQLKELCGRVGPQDVERVKLLKKEVGLFPEQENLK